MVVLVARALIVQSLTLSMLAESGMVLVSISRGRHHTFHSIGHSGTPIQREKLVPSLGIISNSEQVCEEFDTSSSENMPPKKI